MIGLTNTSPVIRIILLASAIILVILLSTYTVRERDKRTQVSDHQTTDSDHSLLVDIDQYQVKEGDTLAGIADSFDLRIETVIVANDLSAQDGVIKEGDILLIPPSDGLIHEVTQGDTIASIAEKYNVDKSLILQWNNIDDPVNLKSGDRIFIKTEIPTEGDVQY